MKTLAERLKATRELRGLSQLDLASKLGIYQTSISRIEMGGETKHIIKLSEVLECDPKWLETGRGFSPFAKTFQYLSGCMQIPLINPQYIREFLKKDI